MTFCLRYHFILICMFILAQNKGTFYNKTQRDTRPKPDASLTVKPAEHWSPLPFPSFFYQQNPIQRQRRFKNVCSAGKRRIQT